MADLDQFDRAILDIVQSNNLKSHGEIGDAVNLSASSVRRRLVALREAGIIKSDVSITDPAGYGATFILHIWFEEGDIESDKLFRRQMQKESNVSQCHSVSGEFDYVLIVHSKTPEDQEKWAERVLLSNPAIRRYTTTVVWSRTKFTTKLPYI